MKKILIMDGNSLANRAFYALPLLTSPDGQPTNVLHGFLTMLLRLLKIHEPEYWVVAFDKTKAKVRIEYYPEYKAQRKPTPDALRPQFAFLKEVLTAMSVPLLELEGYEADDIIASVTRLAQAEGLRTDIVTGDRDALQLVAPAVFVHLTLKGISEVETYDEAKVWEKYELKPDQIIDLKGLMGDSSDNIPGVPGVGEKTALKLLHEYGSVEEVLAHAEEVKGNKIRESLIANKELALVSKKLATMLYDLPMTIELEALRRREPPQEKVLEVFHRYGLQKVMGIWQKARLANPGAAPAAENFDVTELREGVEYNPFATTEPATEATAVSDAVPGAGVGAGLGESGESGAVTGSQAGAEQETPTGAWLAMPKPLTTPIKELSPAEWRERLASWQTGERRICLVVYWDGSGAAGKWLEIGAWDGEDALSYKRRPDDEDAWREYFESAGAKVFLNAKPVYTHLLAEGIHLNGVALDVSLAAYLIDPGRTDYSLETLLRGSDEGLFGPEPAEEAWRLSQLAADYERRAESLGLLPLLLELEQPLTPLLAAMEAEGIGVRAAYLTEYGKELDTRIDTLAEGIYATAGAKFNINSPQQLGKVLFETLGLPVKKKTRKGYATDADTLEELRGEHKIVEDVLFYRQLSKLNSTYVKGLLAEIRDGRIHTSFQQAVTATGRLSSTEPNLQNIPIRLEEGRRLRGVFHAAREGMTLVSADYSQIELRVLAHYSEDPLLCESFHLGQDVHTRTASEVFRVPLAEVTSAMRRSAKAVNFGLMYGLTEFGLARDLGVSREEAKDYMEQYFAKYAGVKGYLESVIEEAKRTGEVRTLMGRLRRVPELIHGNYMTRQFGARVAMNTPIQGSAADIMKKAMLETQAALAPYPAQILLQVHDELVVQTEPEAVPQVAAALKQAMEGAYTLRVPLVADVKTGPDWLHMEVVRG